MKEDTPKTTYNILWFTSDMQRFDTIHCLNNPHIHTPNLDQLCADGVAFTHTYCQNTVCTPTRSSFLTGRYPSSIRACMSGNEAFSDAAPLIPKLLADSGYVCGLSGKQHIASPWLRPEKRVDDGYTFFRYSHSPFARVDQGNGSYGTMIRDRRYKCAIYHGHDYGELYDLEKDRWEHRNLWESEEHFSIRERLIRKAFDSLAFSIDLGPRRIGRY